MSVFDGFLTGGGSSSGGSGDVTGPASSTDNAVARFDSTTGKILQNSDLTVSDLAAGAITVTAGKGTAITLKNTDPDAAAGASVAGDPLTITAGSAVASTDTAGAAAGGSVTITAGAAARNTSGNADGGDIVLATGAAIGTGNAGQVVIPNGAEAAGSGIRFSSAATDNTGWYHGSVGGTNGWIYQAAGGQRVGIADKLQLNSGLTLGWAPAGNLATAADAGLARSAAGVVKVTDGGAGTGSLAFGTNAAGYIKGGTQSYMIPGPFNGEWVFSNTTATGSGYLHLDLNDLHISTRSTFSYVWSATGDPTGAVDTGLAREAAGVVKITNGSTGFGSLNTQLVDAREPAATTGASVAGRTITIAAGDAVASTDTAGAAAGGDIYLTAGNAARNTSGNARPGVVLIPKPTAVGTGTSRGGLVIEGATAYLPALTGGPDNGTLEVHSWATGDFTGNYGRVYAGILNLGQNYSTNRTVSLDYTFGARLGSAMQYQFSSTTASSGSADTGFARSAAGVVKVTDGGAGLGSLWVGGTSYYNGNNWFGGSDGTASTATSVVGNTAWHLGSGIPLGWTPDVNPATSSYLDDLALSRVAAGQIAIKNGTNGMANNIKIATTTVTATGATSTASNLVPAGCILLGVTTRVTTAITSGDGGTSVDIGNGTDVDMYGDNIAFALGTTTNLSNHTASALAFKSAAESVVFTCVGGTFNGGVWRVCAHYLDLTAPTS